MPFYRTSGAFDPRGLDFDQLFFGEGWLGCLINHWYVNGNKSAYQYLNIKSMANEKRYIDFTESQCIRSTSYLRWR